ncbi:MAG: hypothetical protein ACRDTH_23870 [Pseudonocardiaceae bacterium]
MEIGDHERAAAIAEGLHPELHPHRGSQALYWVHYARALSRLRGRRDDAVMALRRAELISPHQVQRDSLARDIVGELLARPPVARRAGGRASTVVNPGDPAVREGDALSPLWRPQPSPIETAARWGTGGRHPQAEGVVAGHQQPPAARSSAGEHLVRGCPVIVDVVAVTSRSGASLRSRGTDRGGCMNIREVIAKLQEMAERLPGGLDSEVRVSICNGNEPGLETPSIGVDTCATQDEKTFAVMETYAIVQGHPHRDERTRALTPVTAQADDILEKWTADQQDGGMGLTPMRSLEGEEYLLLPFSDGTFIKFLLIAGIPMLPGAPEAVAAGCACDPDRNNYGRGYKRGDDVQLVVKDDCPVHLKVEGPVDPDSGWGSDQR